MPMISLLLTFRPLLVHQEYLTPSLEGTGLLLCGSHTHVTGSASWTCQSGSRPGSPKTQIDDFLWFVDAIFWCFFVEFIDFLRFVNEFNDFWWFLYEFNNCLMICRWTCRLCSDLLTNRVIFWWIFDEFIDFLVICCWIYCFLYHEFNDFSVIVWLIYWFLKIFLRIHRFSEDFLNLLIIYVFFDEFIVFVGDLFS